MCCFFVSEFGFICPNSEPGFISLSPLPPRTAASRPSLFCCCLSMCTLSKPPHLPHICAQLYRACDRLPKHTQEKNTTDGVKTSRHVSSKSSGTDLFGLLRVSEHVRWRDMMLCCWRSVWGRVVSVVVRYQLKTVKIPSLNAQSDISVYETLKTGKMWRWRQNRQCSRCTVFGIIFPKHMRL